MARSDTCSAVGGLLVGLAQTEQQPDLASVVLIKLQEAVSACVGAILVSLDATQNEACVGGGPLGRKESLLMTLSKMMEVPQCKVVCSNDHHPRCRDLLARVIEQHPTEHEVQVHAQWSLAQLYGIDAAFQVVKAVAGSATAMKAFLWTVADTPEKLDWASKWDLASHALSMIQQHPTDAEMQQRCFHLLGSRLRADKLGSPGPELQDRQRLAAESVPALVTGLLAWVGSTSSQAKEAMCSASGALNWVCFGGDSDTTSLNPCAQDTFRRIELQDGTLTRVLCKVAEYDLTGSTVSGLLDLLVYTFGSSFLVHLQKHGYFGSQSTSCDPAPAPISEDLRFAILAKVETLDDFQPQEALEAIPAILDAVGETPGSRLMELGTKMLAPLMEGLRTGLPDVGTENTLELSNANYGNLLSKMRLAADRVLKHILTFQCAKEGRWPTKSARALKTAAMADPNCRFFLAKSKELYAATKTRIQGALMRCDANTYWELHSTFLLRRVLWGAGDVLDCLDETLACTSKTVHENAMFELAQAICRVLADTDLCDALTTSDAVRVLRTILTLKTSLLQNNEDQGEVMLKMMGPAAEALGCALGVLGQDADAGQLFNFSNPDNEMSQAASTMVFFLKTVCQVQNLLLTREVCWACVAAVGASDKLPPHALAAVGASGTLSRHALVQAGVVPVLKTVAEQVAVASCSEPDQQEYSLEALSQAFEALGRVTCTCSDTLMAIVACPEVLVVQVAGLRAIRNFLGEGILPQAPEELEALRTACSKAVERYGNWDGDERVSCSAQAILGLLLHHRCAPA